MRSHGMTTLSYDRAKGHSTQYDVVALGYNYRMDDIRAALGIVQLEKLAIDIEKRQAVRRNYVKELIKQPDILIPFSNDPNYVSNYIMPVVLLGKNNKQKNAIREFLDKRGIQTSVHYPPVHRFKIYDCFALNALRHTEQFSDCALTLPMYGSLSKENISYICHSLQDAMHEE